jgi:5-methylcytosine-specific restriction protein A
MAEQLSKSEWTDILTSTNLTNEVDLKIFNAFYGFEDFAASSREIGKILGYSGSHPHAPINSEIGRYAKRIAQKYDINFQERQNKTTKYWDLFFNGFYRGEHFIWKLRGELVAALEESGLVEKRFYAEEIEVLSAEGFKEGVRKSVVVNSYERNQQAREKCIEHWGYDCQVCGLNFENVYGVIGKHYIHVHHLLPISEIGEEYTIDPINDLIPVCPNCHSMIHKETPPLSIEALKDMLKK